MPPFDEMLKGVWKQKQAAPEETASPAEPDEVPELLRCLAETGTVQAGGDVDRVGPLVGTRRRSTREVEIKWQLGSQAPRLRSEAVVNRAYRPCRVSLDCKPGS